MANNKLILRSVISPWVSPFNDITTGSVLSWADVDNNFIYLKGELIHSGYTLNNQLVLEKINGNTINIDLEQFSDEGNRWHIPTGEVVEVPGDYQSFIYGDLYIEGLLKLNDNSQLVVLNGNIILSGGSISGNGTTLLVDLPTFDTKTVSGSYNDGLLTLVNNSGGTVSVNGFNSLYGNYWHIPVGDVVEVDEDHQMFIYGDLYIEGLLKLNDNSQLVVLNGDIILSGGSISGNGTTLSVDLPTVDTKVVSGSYNGNAGVLTLTNNTGGTFNVSGFYTGSTEVFITGGTYNQSNGIATFTNNTGGTFNVSGFLTGYTNYYTTGATLIGSTAYFDRTDALSAYTLDLSGIDFTGNTSASCINDLYISNLHGCSPITIHDSIQHTGSTASGLLSIAFGINTTANGDYSHAEGNSTTASSDYSHAEGASTTASGQASHSEGYQTQATGAYSHAEGSSTTASNASSHSEGYGTTASGSQSHAEGFQTTADNQAAHAEGINSKATGSASHAEGYQTLASGVQGSHAEGYITSAVGETSHAEGVLTTASAYASHSEGHSTTASGTYGSHAEGYQTKAIAESAHAEGGGATASGVRSHAEGNNTTASGYASHAEGNSTKSLGLYSHAEGQSTTASGDVSHAEGYNTTASGLYAHAEGESSSSTGQGSHAEGQVTKAIGSASHAEGAGTISQAYASHAEGANTTALTFASHAEGELTTSSGDASHSEGKNTTASGNYSHAGGISSVASGLNSFIHSSGSTVSGIRSVVLGGKGLSGPANDTVYVPNFNSRGTSIFSGSASGVVTIIGSGSTTPIFSVQGSSGELFSVTDSLVGSLFSVNDISGLPILEAFSDNTILMGSYQAPSLNTTIKKTLSSGTNNIYSIPTSAYTGAFFDYTLLSSTGARAGNIMSIWSGSSAQYTDTSTNDIGSTSGVTFSVVVSGSSAVLVASGTTSGWTLKTIVRSI